MTDIIKRAGQYPVFYDPYTNERYEDHSITGGLIDGLDRKLQALGRETYHRSPHLTEDEKSAQQDRDFSHHIKAWDRPAMALSKRLDGKNDTHLVHVPWDHDTNNER